ncbi:PP2C family protein-serine/threonine phosphatase [Prevotella sp. E2-28]|uniref:PP2C family protein-serine/threonine phosphatase n=1 Tax=Prevotella sp. E2-28 TaxID=2913620 RepID=UPI001EDA5F62|nr:SpoIIE family protein phosphatase [Prevotella sp. E2-28]UKK54945.1 SpoIIE family protein phosphatase [Prevotella sp. E2-28]
MPTKILSVDDEMDLELLLTQYFRRKIRKGEYEFHFAHNGVEALTMMLQHKDFDIILSDINMPEMDGLTLLTKINEMQNPAMKCIMVSAYGDMGNIRQAMNNGAFDFATKPIDLDDLSVTIEKAIEQIDYIKQSQKEHTQLESLKTDLAVAGEIQQAILPRVFPPFPEIEDILDVSASMTPAKDVGGDFYDFFRIDEDRIGFVMADVSGKGVPAAIFMAVSRTLIRAIGMQGNKPDDVMTRANELLCKESVNCMFVTVFYAIYNTKTGEINYCNAGHNSPYIIHVNGQAEALPMSTNCMIGALEELDFEAGSLSLEKGDMLVMYTDGVNEAVNNDLEEYGEPRLKQTLNMLQGLNCQETVNGILASVKAFADGAPQSDDITLLSFKRK